MVLKDDLVRRETLLSGGEPKGTGCGFGIRY